MLFAYLDENCNVRLVHIYREVWEFFEDNVTQLGAYLGRFVREFLVGALGFDLESLRVLKRVGEIVERVAEDSLHSFLNFERLVHLHDAKNLANSFQHLVHVDAILQRRDVKR